MNVDILVHARRIIERVAVVAGFENDRALICCASYMGAIFYYVIAYLDVAAGADLPPDAYIGRKKQGGKRHSVNIAVLYQNVVCLHEEASCASVSHGATVDVKRGEIFRICKRVSHGKLAGEVAPGGIVILVYRIDYKFSLLFEGVRVIDVYRVPR